MYFGVVNGAGRFLDLHDTRAPNLCTALSSPTAHADELAL